MLNEVMALLLCAAIALLYWQDRQQAEPVLRICSNCGDVVQLVPGWPTRCPSCRAFLIG